MPFTYLFAMPPPAEDTPAAAALRKSLDADRRQLTELNSRIASQEAELAALLSAAAADTRRFTGTGTGAGSPTKKRKHEELVSSPDKLKTDTSQLEDVIAQVMADPMLLGSFILPCLNGAELSRSAEISKLWKRTATGPKSDHLWKALAMNEWTDMTKALVDAGALAHTNFRDFYLRRTKPAVTKSPSLAEDDELFVLVDMPNLVKANDNGTESVRPLQPLHKMFPLVSGFRKDRDHQNIFDETLCSCNVDACSHLSSWLNFPFANEVFRPNPDTVNRDSADAEIFRLDISILRKSDGKVIKVLQSASNQCENELPDGFGDPWATYKHGHGCPPSHMARQRLQATAGVNAENMHRDHWYESDGHIDFKGLSFSLQHIVFGLEVYDPYEFATSMVPMDSVDKMDMILNMMRLRWS